MLTITRAQSTAADLLRLLAVWLALILLAQGFAAAFARAQGPWHQHQGAPARMSQVQASHSHTWGERHHHDAGDSSVQTNPATDAADDDARLALTAALALLALGLCATFAAPRHCHVLRAAPAWACGLAPPSLPFKPPRRG